MKAFHLITLLIIFIIKCGQRTEKINNKVCTTNDLDMIDCGTDKDLQRDKCERLGCCYVHSHGPKKCFYPSCNNGCKECGAFGNCNQCQESFYLTEDTKMCFNSVIDYYYLDDKTLKKCYDNCLKCSSSSKNIQNPIYDSIKIDMNCISCKNNYYKLNGTNNCYDESFKNKGYYLKDDIYYPCEKNCLTCSDKKNNISNNCLTCDNSQELYLVEGLNNCEKGKYSGYYLDYNQKKFIKCYSNCKYYSIFWWNNIFRRI